VKVNYDIRDCLPEAFLDILRAMNYKPGWELHVEKLGWPGFYHPDTKVFETRVHPSFDIVCVNTGQATRLHGENVSVPTNMDEEHTVSIVFSAIRKTEIHEAEEQFTYNNIRVFNPHRSQADRDKLFELASLHKEEWVNLGTTLESQLRIENGSAGTSSALSLGTGSLMVRKRPACPSHE
jgi:hypothetical protein